jgi:hypothetical protein
VQFAVLNKSMLVSKKPSAKWGALMQNTGDFDESAYMNDGQFSQKG